MKIEICCNSIYSAFNAIKAGVGRIELCRDLPCGGLSPDMEDVAFLCDTTPLEVRVLLRPRPGDFCYSDAEYERIRQEALLCKRLEAHAVVVGFLTKEGKIDMERTREIVELVAPLQVTFHRAFDELSPADAPEALEKIIACGCHKLLTSGCAPTALEGADTIARLVQQSQGRIGIIAASGVTPATAQDIVRRTGVSELHGSCKAPYGPIELSDKEQVKSLIRLKFDN